MSQIKKDQGAIKLSEVVTDTELSSVPAQPNEDMMTVAEVINDMAADTIMKNNMFVSSSEPISWAASEGVISIPQGVELNVFFLQNSADSIANSINFKYTGIGGQILNGAVPSPSVDKIALGIGQMLFLEISRDVINALPAGLQVVNLDFFTAGMKLAVYSEASFPSVNASSGTYQSTISIPLAYRISASRIAWMPSNIHWEGDFTSMIGQQQSAGGLPIGTIMALTSITGLLVTPITQPDLDLIAPGWMLMNGQTVNNPDSPFDGMALQPIIDDRSLNGNETSLARNNAEWATARTGTSTFSLRADHNVRHRHVSLTIQTQDRFFPSLNRGYVVDRIGNAKTTERDDQVGRFRPGYGSTNHYHPITGVDTATDNLGNARTSAVKGDPHNNVSRAFRVVFIIKVVD